MAGTDEDKKDAAEETAKVPEEAEEKDADKKDDDDKKNNEDELVTEVSAETLSNVAERLKFFFSDANIRVDRFMQNQINVRQASGKRPVPIEVLLRFNTLKKYTTDASVVIAAAKQLLSEQLVVVVNDNNEKDSAALQRVHSFTMEMMNDNIPKTLVVSNLPITKSKKKEAEKEEDEEEEATYAISMDDIRKVFEELGPVAMIRMRFGPSPKQQQQQAKKNNDEDEEHHDNKDDCSPSSRPHQRVQYRYPAQYAFVEYETTADCEKALAEVLTCKQGNEVEPKRKLRLGGNDLKVTSLQDYMDEQKMKRQAKKEDKNSTATGAQDEKQPADEDGGTENNKSESSYTVDWKPGCVIKLEGLADGCDREAIMTAVAKAMDYSTVEALKDDKLVYVDYSRGQATGAIRFFEPNDKIKTLLSKLWKQECPSTTTTTPATAATEKVGGGDEGGDKDAKNDTATDKKDASGDEVIEIAGAKVEKAYLLEGEQEEKYWKEFIDFKNHQKKRQAESSDNRHHQNNNNRSKHHHRNPKRQKRRHS